MTVETTSSSFDTFGGLVFAALGQIPEDGTTCDVTTEKLEIKVLNVTDHQMDAAIVTVITPPDADEDEDDEEKDEE